MARESQDLPQEVAQAIAAADSGQKSPSAPGSIVFTLSLAVGALWIMGVGASTYALLGEDLIGGLTPVQWAAIAAAALLPALMAWFSGAAAREGARARSEAQRLADAADRLMNPARSATDATRELTNTVRSEIHSLDRAVEHTLSRLKEVEGLIHRQSQTVDDMTGRAKAGAGQMILGMERERDELMKISRDLTAQAEAISGSIGKHTQVIGQAARMAEQEVRAADQALDNRLTSFGAAAALITDRTQALSGAAQASADSALRLETALSSALDVLAKATNLTDAARQSADEAAVAANSTAGAVRDTTARAIEDAKRAADLIRGEASTVEREAAVALERLRDAAEAARSAAIGARTAIESDTRRAPRSAPPQRREAEPDWRSQEEHHEQADERDYDRRQRYDPPRPEPRAEPRRRPEEPMFGEPERGPGAAPSGEWTWRDLLSGVDETPAAGASRPRNADPVARLAQTISEPRVNAPSLPAAGMIENAGVRLADTFSGSALERIAQRARSGTQARRRAVKDAAPEAVRQLADHLAHDARANQEAMQFLRSDGARIAELLARGRAAMNADATRAFLLIDSAAG